MNDIILTIYTIGLSAIASFAWSMGNHIQSCILYMIAIFWGFQSFINMCGG